MTTLLLGIGHPDRGDDAAGVLVVDRLRAAPHMITRRVTADPTDVLTDPLWDTADRVVLVDTVRTWAPPGTVHRWQATGLLDLIDPATPVTHELGVAATLGLAQALHRLPRDLTLIGIEGSGFEHGSTPCDAVLAAVERVAAELEIGAAMDPGGDARVPR